MFDKPAYFFNRELSWLKFNQRVLQEAIDEDNPVLEQLRFIAITSSNVDEFFMIRVAGLKHYVENNVNKIDSANMTPKMQLDSVGILAKRLVKVQYTYLKRILKSLEDEGIFFKKPCDLNDEQEKWLHSLFRKNIYPVVTPLAVDSSHPFPFLANRTINMAVKLQQKSNLKTKNVTILPIPSVLDRIIEVPNTSSEKIFIMLEDVILHYAHEFFLGYDINEHFTFRVTRDADLEITEDGKDLLREMEKSLRARRRGMAVRIEAQIDDRPSIELRNFIVENLQLTNDDLYEIDGPLDAKMYFSFCDIPGYDYLRYKIFEPCTPADLVGEGGDYFEIIRKKDILVHHPFETFDSVRNFIEQAANDPRVLAIKQTLYRVSPNSPIIASLAKAADNGKQVTVLMEVKARFDEENNIIMARKLEKAGCHVIYGLVGLKTHSKITMVVRHDNDGIRRYVHLATGNYNGSTAKIYTDCGIITCHEAYGEDASAFFNLISGYSDPPQWNKFAVAPLNLREMILEHIDNEIKQVENGQKGHIIAKINSLLDEGIIRKLYEASSKGVKIDLVIRGICTLRPGIKNVSENIHVRSIIGRFLEHHRLLYFYNGGEEKVFISSADWMPRNLNDRVELLIPVEDKRHKQRIIDILNIYLADNTKAHVMRADGTYYKHKAKDNKINAQEILCNMAIKLTEMPKLSITERMKPVYK